MRWIVVFLVSMSVTVLTQAQTVLAPATPALTPGSSVLAPASPALTPTSSNGVITTNATLTALSESLLALQANLQQTLPVLQAFNDNFDFVSLSGNAVTGQGTAGSGNNFAVNAGVNFATNLGVNSAVPTGPGLFNKAANAVSQVPLGTSQGIATIPVTRDVLRALIVLQGDMQRMLPVLNTLSGGVTNLPGSFTNLFNTPPSSP